MTERTPPGTGSTPGVEDQATQAATGKPAQVPGTPGGPNADAFDVSSEAEALRPRPNEGPGDPLAGAGELDDVQITES